MRVIWSELIFSTEICNFSLFSGFAILFFLWGFSSLTDCGIHLVQVVYERLRSTLMAATGEESNNVMFRVGLCTSRLTSFSLLFISLQKVIMRCCVRVLLIQQLLLVIIVLWFCFILCCFVLCNWWPMFWSENTSTEGTSSHWLIRYSGRWKQKYDKGAVYFLNSLICLFVIFCCTVLMTCFILKAISRSNLTFLGFTAPRNASSA